MNDNNNQLVTVNQNQENLIMASSATAEVENNRKILARKRLFGVLLITAIIFTSLFVWCLVEVIQTLAA